MPKFKPKMKKKSSEGQALKGKTAAELFQSKEQQEILNSSLKSINERSEVYKGLFKR